MLRKLIISLLVFTVFSSGCKKALTPAEVNADSTGSKDKFTVTLSEKKTEKDNEVEKNTADTPVKKEPKTALNVKKAVKEARKYLFDSKYKKATELAEEILKVDPDNRDARKTIRRAAYWANEREDKHTQLRDEIEEKEIQHKYEKEFKERIRDVDKASIPYIEPKNIKTTTNKSAYSQEIIEEEENEDISMIREELKTVLIDLDFRDADLREVIRYLAEVSEINIILDENALLNMAQPASQPMQNFIAPIPQAPGIPAVGQPMQNPQNQYPQPQNNPYMSQQPGVNNQGVYNQNPVYNQNQAGIMPQQQNNMYQNSAQNMPQQQNQQNGSKMVSNTGNTATYQAPPPPKVSTPKITIFLKQIPLLTALDIILRTKGLKYKIEKDFIWISTADKLSLEDLVTRIYTIQHAIGEFANFETESLDLSALNISTGDNVAGQFFNQSGSSATQSYAPPQPQQQQTEAKAAEDLVSTLTKIVPQPQGASMTLYQRTGKLIVRNTPKNLRLLEGLLRNLDVSSLQVSIEVRLVEVSALDGLDIGQTFSWEKFNPSTTTTQTIGSEVVQQGFGRALTASTGGFSYVLSKTSPEEVDISIQALVARNRATILSAPKLTCLNNQTANLKIVRNTSYIASNRAYSNTTDGVTATNTSQNIGQIPEGIVLQITPNVSADKKTIRLTVHPQVTELLEMEEYVDSSGNNKTQLPSISQRSLDTTVSVENSGTLVLGGLMRGSERKSEKGVPGLRKIPLVGNLFKNHNKVKDRDNLIIFITASILNADGDMIDIQVEEKKSEIVK